MAYVIAIEHVGAASHGMQAFFHGMLDEGVYLAPSAYEAGFVSAAHTQDDLQKTIDAAAKVISTMQASL